MSLMEKLKKLTEDTKTKESTQIQCAIDQIRGLIDKENDHIKLLGEYYINHIEHTSKCSAEYEGPIKLTQFYNFLLTNKELLTKEELQDLPAKFFKSLGSDEFGISRLIADPLNNVPKMLERFSIPECIKDDIYIIYAEYENSLGDKIRLDYRYRAPNQEEANRQSQAFINRINGRQKKVYEACWAMANDKLKRGIISCDLTDLMVLIKPSRKKESFTTEERFEFFQDLLDLAATQLTLTKKEQPKRKKDKINKFLLPFITIHKTSDYNMTSNKINERYPNDLSFSVLHNPLYEKEKMYNVGAGIKRKTLELHNDDLQLAEYIQIRKSQKMKEKFITFTERLELIKLANLSGIKHSGMANKKLLHKFERLKEEEIIISFPKKVTFPFHIKIR